jgi:hypothetical protein
MTKSLRNTAKLAAAAMEPRVCADGGLAMLKERQIKDAQEVASGKRSARSLMVVGKGDLKGFRFTQNPASKFAVAGTGW